jgi:hypothetical protein
MLTFEEFQNSKRWVADLSAALPDLASNWDKYRTPRCGYVYDDAWYIEEVQPDWSASAYQEGAWVLTRDWGDLLISDDLPALERLLYDYLRYGG